MTRPLLSIIIPTRNRKFYLINTIKCLFEATEAEIIVSDNSDKPLDIQKIGLLNFKERLIYSHTNDILSVVDNFNRALELSSGEYVIFIGDDDCVGPSIEKVVKWAKSHDIDSIISYKEKFIASYYWPEISSQSFRGNFSGKLFLRKFTGKVNKVNGRNEILKTINDPGTGLNGLLRAYHGIVKRSLIDKIIAKYGSLFGGVSPDIYSATLISYESEKAYCVDYPFVVPGASPKSTAGDVTSGKHLDKLNSREHITRFGENLIWNEEIPKFYATHTVWAYSQQQALKLIDNDQLKMFLPNLYWRCLFKYKNHHSETLQAIKYYSKKNKIQFFSSSRVAYSIFTAACGQINRLLRRIFSPPIVYSDINTIDIAYDSLKSIAPPWTADENINYK